MSGRGTDRATQLLCAWAGPAATLLALLGMVIVAGFIPPQDPSAGGREIANFYSDNSTQIAVGMAIAMTGFTLFVPFGIAIALQIKRTERRPAMTYVQIAAVAIAALEGVMAAVIWATASFRPADIDPDITRAIHDLGWFAFLFDIPPFSLWLAAIGIAVLRDPLPAPVFPRWAGYLNLWAALLIVPGMLMAFFKTGPFAYNGLFALYLPFSVFFGWILVMTPLVIRAINREAAEAAEPA